MIVREVGNMRLHDILSSVFILFGGYGFFCIIFGIVIPFSVTKYSAYRYWKT